MLEEELGVVEGFFLFLFLFGGRRGLGGEGVRETVESRLSDVGERGDGKGAVNGRERWGKRGGRVEDVRGGRFWEGNFGVVDGGEGWEEGFRLLFSVFWISLGGALGGGILHCLVRGKGREGGGERGEEGGEIGEKGIQGWRGKEEEKDRGEERE